MGLNKKGIFFTTLVILILTLFLISYTVYSTVQERRTTQKRIETMNSFLFSLEQDLNRKMYITGFRIIFLMDKHILETGSYISDVEDVFQEAFFNATIEGINDTELQTIMAESTFEGISNFINERSSNINVNVVFENPEISISQDNPWYMKTNLTMDLSMQDQSGLALWNKTASFIAEIPIEGFQDPTYILVGGSGVAVNITKTPYMQIDSSNIHNHASNPYYTNYSGAPNFLNRLEGDLSATSECCGIESLVYTKVNNIPPDISVIDYEFFQNLNGIHPDNSPSWFYLSANTEHCNVYGAVC